MRIRSIKHLTLLGSLALTLGTAPLTAAASPNTIFLLTPHPSLLTPHSSLLTSHSPSAQRRDSTRIQSARILQPTVRRELPDIRHQMLTSPQPVEIRQQGRNLCVTSRYNQLLPVYTANGSLYSSFRINKGTNWLSGLPRGSYIINHQKYTIN
ncbi:MAG: hypothetical protein K6A32_01220 [Bacteroidales bacterium]|nr:hypothetical protein [Bacteroidales bacterium]